MDLTKREKTGLIIFSIIVVSLISFIYFNNRNRQEIQVVKSSGVSQVQNKSQPGKIYVCIYGEVKNPGVYILDEGDRVDTLISMAGGFTEKADFFKINRSAKLKDEDMITVYPKIEKPSISAGTIPAGDKQQVSGADPKININTAGIDELEKLPGIGETIAERIVKYREEKGYFNDIKDIKNVSGIGDAKFKSIEDKITVH